MKQRQKIAYSFGALGSALTYNSVHTYVVFYYADVLHVPIQLIGIVMVAYGIWNSINDPLFGYLSDRTRTKWGRRVPYIAGGLIPLSLVFIFLWTPPFGNGYLALLVYFLVMMFLFEGLYTLVVLNWTALFPEMFQSLKDRAAVSMWRQVFGNIGLIIGVALTPMVYDALGWQSMALIYGIVTAMTFIISLLGTKENVVSKQSEQLKVLPALKYTLANKSFLTYVTANVLIQFTFVLILAVIPFYAKYVLEISPTEQTLLLASVFIVVFIMLTPWRLLTIKIGARQSMSVAIAAFCISLLPFGFAYNFVTGIIAGAFLGVGLAGILLILDILLADVIDEDSIRTGQRREGTYFGVNALFMRLGVSAQALVLSQVMVAYGYDPLLAVQPVTLITGLRILVAAIPISALIGAFIAIRMYPLRGENVLLKR
jgi:GPH family glycoside/pentoside/hexuronide:cation symporter